MGDQQKWFKLWQTALSDDQLMALPPERRWAWAALGCHTKIHGTDGRVEILHGNPVLAASMGVTPETLFGVISALPNVRVEEGNARHGMFTVTWKHWRKYQEDSTSGERARRYRARAASRNKRRRDKRRSSSTSLPPEDKKHLPPGDVQNGGAPAPIEFHVPKSVVAALERCPFLGRDARLHSPALWRAIVRAHPPVDFARELLKAEKHCVANPKRAPKSDFARFIASWMARAESDYQEI